MKIKKVYFDMDGTIADLYGQDNWLERLLANEPNLYSKAQPLIDLNILKNKVEYLQEKNIEVGIITWLAKVDDNNYHKTVTKEKLEWLENTGIKFDTIHIVKYGTPKHDIPKTIENTVLFDDNADVRLKWHLNGGIALDEKHIFKNLNEIIKVG